MTINTLKDVQNEGQMPAGMRPGSLVETGERGHKYMFGGDQIKAPHSPMLGNNSRLSPRPAGSRNSAVPNIQDNSWQQQERSSIRISAQANEVSEPIFPPTAGRKAVAAPACLNKPDPEYVNHL
jgi:hypothetical protein